MKKLLTTIVVMLAAFSIYAQAEGDNRTVHKNDGSFVEENASQAVARMVFGYNLGNSLDAQSASLGKDAAIAAYETCWGQPVTTKKMIDYLKKAGFTAVRVPVTWVQHLDANGNVKKEWMDRVQEVVDYVIDNGMYCILNVHHDTGSGDSSIQWIKADLDNYEANHTKYEHLWTQIATRFQNYGQRLLFESYNEMLDANNTWNAPRKPSGYTAVNKYAQSFVTAVRNTGGNNANRNLIVNTYAAASNAEAVNNFQLPTDPAIHHLAVEVHTYGPWNWFKNYGVWNNACHQELTNMFKMLHDKYAPQGIPVVIGEYGTHGDKSVNKKSSATEIQAAADQAADMVRQSKANGMASFYWMSVFEGSDREVPQFTLPTVVSAMQQAYNE